jgi:NhaA family Na+:H+ antiporter
VVLLVATVVALVWASSPWGNGYRALWSADVGGNVGPIALPHDLAHWVNDGLMAIFFFVVGLELKREVVHGQLGSVRAAALPLVCASGGMALPPLIFLVINAGGHGSGGWGIPMATDIAFAVGVLALLGPRVPAELKVLLLAIAALDDVGAIVVIALFYGDGVRLGWLAAALGALGLVIALMQVGVRARSLYGALAVAVWVCTYGSGIHATIAGVALGLVVPASHRAPDQGATSVADRLMTQVNPWSSLVVVPLFALANAGIPLSLADLADAGRSPITAGIVAGLVVGKLVGVSAAAWVAVRLGLARLPRGVTWRHIVGMAAIAGIGFTVSLFIAGLAYFPGAVHDDARMGILAASVLAATLGLTLLLSASTQRRR